MIAIINYGIGNLFSVQNMLKKAGEENVLITNDKEVISIADKLILPGVGHFDFGMKKLYDSNLIGVIEDKVIQQRVPILGICLGAQLFTKRSDEGNSTGLGWIDAETVRFDKNLLSSDCKIPHMGWNFVKSHKENPLFENMYNNPRFYFVHSYHFKMNDSYSIWLSAYYGYEFCAAFQRDNIFACQFHPEKSHKFGLRLMQNFVNL
jgi:glutamine amidotransferase